MSFCNLCLFAHNGVQHIVLCFCFVFLLLVYPMLPVSLQCPLLIVPSLFSGLSIIDRPFCILWIVHCWSPLLYSLDCPLLITPSVFSGLSIIDRPFGILWIVHYWSPLRYSLTFIHFHCIIWVCTGYWSSLYSLLYNFII